ncbi:unnamed protein product [Anisakis simplex]|uniref:Spore germination protein n=1 Tax=Anisakis simplex TaxID=6269 RepID=A0A0M3KCH5_ANISI|nr:unnamed protein product [Anisakis simplex]
MPAVIGYSIRISSTESMSSGDSKSTDNGGGDQVGTDKTNGSSSVQQQHNSTIVEGQAKITFSGPSSAFYNPVQEFNRDLTFVFAVILFIRIAPSRQFFIDTMIILLSP